MKKIFPCLLAFLSVFSMFAAAPDSLAMDDSTYSNPIDKETCSYKGIPLYGRVKIVESFADFDIQLVDAFSDIDVQVVTAFPDQCGRWQFVDAFPDFTVRIVNSFADFRVRYVSAFPGVR